MFRHLKAVSVLSLILFLAGVFCIIFSINEINTVTAENSGHYESEFVNSEFKKIIVIGSIPMNYVCEYGDKFNISVENINPEHIEISENGEEVYINYEITSKNMDRLFYPVINYAADTKPLVKITLPDGLAVAECIDKSIDYFFNLDVMKIINSRYYPDTNITLVLGDADALYDAAVYIDPAYAEIAPECPEEESYRTYEELIQKIIKKNVVNDFREIP